MTNPLRRVNFKSFHIFFPLDGRKTATTEQCCVSRASRSALIRCEAEGKNRRVLLSACLRSNLCIPKTSNQVGKHIRTHLQIHTHNRYKWLWMFVLVRLSLYRSLHPG